MNDRPTIWDTLSLGLWALFFAMGLAPELAFRFLRDLAELSSFTAMVNSSFFITMALVGYLSWFVYHRILDAGLSSSVAVGKCIQCAIIALVAFMDLPSGRSSFETHTILELLFQLPDMPDLYVKGVVVLVVFSKLAAWWYLYALVFRYHIFANRHIFANMPSVFPSAKSDGEELPLSEPLADVPEASEKANSLDDSSGTP